MLKQHQLLLPIQIYGSTNETIRCPVDQFPFSLFSLVGV